MNKIELVKACIVCVLSLCTMVLTLINNGKQEDVRSFSPPPFEKAAVSGMPTVLEELGWSEIYQMEWNLGIYLWKCDCERRCSRCLFYEFRKFDVWLKLVF